MGLPYMPIRPGVVLGVNLGIYIYGIHGVSGRGQIWFQDVILFRWNSKGHIPALKTFCRQVDDVRSKHLGVGVQDYF